MRSLDSFVPADQPAKLKLIEKAAKVADARRSIRNPSMPRRSTRRTSKSLKSSVDACARRRATRKAARRRRLAPARGRVAEARRCRSGDARTRRRTCSSRRCKIDARRDEGACCQAQPVTLKNLPPELVDALEGQGRADPRRGAAEGRSQRQRQSAQIRRRRARGRADRDRRAGVDPEIRRHHRARLHPRRHLGAARDQLPALDRRCAASPTC